MVCGSLHGCELWLSYGTSDCRGAVKSRWRELYGLDFVHGSGVCLWTGVFCMGQGDGCWMEDWKDILGG